MTWRELIKGSLRMIGAIAATETPSAEEQNDALSALNNMLASWSTEGLTMIAPVREEFALVAGTAAYTIGPTGTFNTSRPLEIEQASVEDATVSPALEFPVDIINLRQWSMISQKDTQNTYPTKLYYETTSPLATIRLWPVPSAAYNLVLYSRKPLASATSLSATIALPPGYERAIKYNLAIEISPEYGKTPAQEVVAIAMESKANIKRQNTKPMYLECDAGVMARTRSFNILTGE